VSDGIAEKLATRGFWRVEARPADYVERRVQSIAVLRRVIEKSRVELRGWDFPHMGKHWDLPDSQASVGVDTDWGTHVETWRAFLSGQFVFRGSIWTDWMDQHHFSGVAKDWKPSTSLPIVSSLWSLTEFMEFAARYSQTEAGGDPMVVDISLHRLRGRVLVGDHDRRVWFDNYGPARLDTFSFSRTVARTELVSTAAQLARDAATELFTAFGYEPHPSLLDEVQKELLAQRRGA
jgi:hypothetical protein